MMQNKDKAIENHYILATATRSNGTGRPRINHGQSWTLSVGRLIYHAHSTLMAELNAGQSGTCDDC